MEILKAVLILGGLGFIFGIGLAIASKKFEVTADPRLETVHHLLPGANCGACGNPGCFAFAESLLNGKVKLEACRVCRKEVREKIAEILNAKEGKG
jgi:Na+-translocating ferredoxin:NAD+ oxidoreductase subunit B